MVQYSTRDRAPVFQRAKGGIALPRQSRTPASDLTASTKFMTGTIQTSSRDDRASMAAPPRTYKSCTSNSRNRLDVRTCLRIATWNVLTLNHTGYVSALVRQLKTRRIELAGITEARLTGNGSAVVEGATVLHSGGIHHVSGVPLFVHRPLMDHLVKWTPISDRILSARWKFRIWSCE